MIFINKSAIRTNILETREGLAGHDVFQLSLEICNVIESSEAFKNAQNILFYYPIRKEVSLISLMKKNIKQKNIFFPKCEDNNTISYHKIYSPRELIIGKYGINEPSTKSPSSETPLDLIFVPGLAFDKKLNRIGYGKGFYDNFLKNKNCIKIAPAYDFQIFNSIPSETHDQRVNMIITQSQIYK